MRKLLLTFASIGLMGLSGTLANAEIELKLPEPGSVSEEQGLEAFSRIYEVTSSPRCSNCHVGASNIPMWSGPSFGKARPHGMNINAGESRIGAEALQCSTCHTTLSEPRENANSQPHHAPRVAGIWQLAPVEAEWFGKSAAQICAQLKDPELNGDRDFMELANHLGHDVVLKWAWNPGGNRQPAPYSLEEHANDILQWGVAGMPCPAE